MNTRPMYRALVFATIFLGGCETVPVPRLAQPESSGLGIAVKFRAPIALFEAQPDLVYFAKLDNENELLQQQIIRSNYVKDGRAYLLNIPPGTYAAVGAFFARAPIPAGPPSPGFSVTVGMGRTGYTTYFSQDLMEQTKVKVGESHFVFMGAYVVSQSVGLAEADPVQTHYANVIAPGAVKSGLLHFLSGDYHYQGTARESRNDEQTRGEFLRQAKEDLAEGGWAARVK